MSAKAASVFDVGKKRFSVWQDVLRPLLIAVLIAVLLLLGGVALFQRKRGLALFMLATSGLVTVLLILAFSQII